IELVHGREATADRLRLAEGDGEPPQGPALTRTDRACLRNRLRLVLVLVGAFSGLIRKPNHCRAMDEHRSTQIKSIYPRSSVFIRGYSSDALIGGNGSS